MKKNALVVVTLCLFAASCGSDGGSPSTNLTSDETNAAAQAVESAAGSALNTQRLADERESLENNHSPHRTSVNSATVNCAVSGTMTVTGSATMSISGSTLPITFTATDLSITVTANNCVTTYNGAQYTVNSSGVTLSGNWNIVISAGDAVNGTINLDENGSFTVNSNSCSVNIDAAFTLTTTGNTETTAGTVTGTACGNSITNTVSTSTTI